MSEARMETGGTGLGGINWRSELTRQSGQSAQQAFVAICLLAIGLPLLLLVLLVGAAFAEGRGRLSWEFLMAYPSRLPELAGIWPALAGSACLLGLTAALAIPVGIGAAIYLEEYATPSRWTLFIEFNIANLAGVPSVLYGLLGLEVFVRAMGAGRSLIAGAATLALLLLPMIIIAGREALRTVPNELRQACFALGSDRWQMLRQIVLPLCVPGMLTGIILSLARAIGETAPLITIGALTYVAFLPDSLTSPFTALPIQIFNWVSRPQAGFHTDAAAGIIVLLGLLLIGNGAAIVLRERMRARLGS